jgi:hypothetical protein
MTAISITPGYPTFADTDGSPLNDGYVYIGLEYQDPITAPTTAFWDKDFRIPADQPLRTSGGYVVRDGSPAAVYTGAAYSILVQNKNLVTVYNAPSAVITNVTNNVEEITQYQGAHATDPVARNDGTPLQTGDLYFNTVVNELKVWTGTVWVPAVPGTVTVENFTGTGAQTAFNLATAPVAENNTQIYIDGVYQQKDTYTLSGATINFSTAPPYLSGIEVVTFSIASLGTVDSSNVSYNEGSLGAVNTSVQAKLQETVSVKDFGAVGDGVTDDTAAIQLAFNAANNKTLLFNEGTYLVSKGVSDYVLEVPNSISIVGTEAQVTIKLSTATGTAYMLGRATASSHFSMEGIILDGNSTVLTGINCNGVHLPEASIVKSKNNSYLNLKDQGSALGGKGIYANNSTLYISEINVENDTFSNITRNAVQTYNGTQITIKDCYGTGFLTSFTDINGQSLGVNVRTKCTIKNNVVNCDAAFTLSDSVFSLLGDDVECTGNKVTGGGVQIVVHDMTGTTVSLRNYVVSDNMLWNSLGNGITINQNSATYGNNSNQQIVVSNNNIYSPALTGISVIGAYVGSGATLGSTVISGNTVVDGLTNNLVPETAAGISLLGTVNAVVDSNVIISPRWAGIMAYYDGSNISISNNIITDHQGRTSSGGGTSTPQAGAPIYINGGGATVALENINVTGNIIKNYATAVSPQASYVRTGGIVVTEAKAKDISIKNNRIMDGNTVGISVFDAINVIVESNEVTGFYSKALLTQTPGSGCQFTYAISGARYDTTANRPTLESVQGGYQYWDTSLTKPIWWNGSVWKDVSNVTV